jgi:hypothetical protein
LLLFVGDFPFREVKGTWFLGSDLSSATAVQLGEGIAEIEREESQIVNLPFRDSLVLIEHSALNQSTRRGTWGFTTWPTIAIAGAPLGNIARGLSGQDSTMNWVRHFLSHELGHYYFGTVLQPRGPWRWFYTESTAEYLSLVATLHFQGEAALRQLVSQYWQHVRRMEHPVPLNRIEREDQIGETYRYEYAPLLLLELREEIGDERMGHVLHELLTAPVDRARDYGLLRAAVLGAGTPPAAWDRFERECVTPPPGQGCLQSLASADTIRRAR